MCESEIKETNVGKTIWNICKQREREKERERVVEEKRSFFLIISPRAR